jgi:glutamate carboxypeptidase
MSPTYGRPSHAGLRLSEGRSAIRKMAEKIIDIEAMTSEDCSFSVGVMQRRKMGELRFIKSQC